MLPVFYDLSRYSNTFSKLFSWSPRSAFFDFSRSLLSSALATAWPPLERTDSVKVSEFSRLSSVSQSRSVIQKIRLEEVEKKG